MAKLIDPVLREIPVCELHVVRGIRTVDDTSGAREVRVLHDVQESDFSQDPYRGRHERLADVRPRVVEFFDDQRIGEIGDLVAPMKLLFSQVFSYIHLFAANGF